MPDVPLSRRARRDMEAQAAERAAAQHDRTRSPAQGSATGEFSGADTDGHAFSRRDRRRVERLARPMESWTAEEEMIATGHIPAMTPERIAEQEILAREAAERAAVDAQTASAELRILAQRDLDAARPGESATAPVRMSSADMPLVQHAPRADAEAAVEEPSMVEPYSPRFEPDDREMTLARDESESLEVPTGFDPEAKIERTPAPSGEPDPDDADGQPLAWSESFEAILAPPSEERRPAFAAPPAVEAPADEAPAVELPADEAPVDEVPAVELPADEAPAVEAPAVEVPAVELPAAAEAPAAMQTDAEAREAEAAAARAKVFDELFPPGSSQAALLEQDRREREAAAAAQFAEPATSAPAQDDDEEAERQRGIEEIRRLTEAAINGIEKKAQPEDASDQSAGADRYEMPADPGEGHGFRGFGAPASPLEFEQPHASAMPDPGALAPPSGQFPITPAPHQATFDEMVRTRSTEIPVRHMNQQQPTQESVPSQWGSHPLDTTQASAPHDVSSFQPVSDAPRPDLSQLNNRPSTGQFPAMGAQPPTTSGQFPTTGSLFTSDPSATGQIAPLRRTPDLPPVGGASHFKWLHLAVIGALVFVLGVVIYNVWLGQ